MLNWLGVVVMTLVVQSGRCPGLLTELRGGRTFPTP